MSRVSKIKDVGEILDEYLEDGIDIALGGILTYNTPSAMARAIINSGKGGFTLYSFMGTYPVDLLIGSGLVDRVMAPFITFGEMGLAPAFRRMVESGRVRVIEVDERFWGFSLKAGAANLPFIPLAEGYDTDIPRVNPMYKFVESPFNGKKYVAIPPLKPSLSFIYVQYSDEYGNGINMGNPATDRLLAKASRRVILICDRLIPHEEVRRRNRDVTIPGFLVDAVVELEFACHPLGSDTLYRRDDEHLMMYIKMAKTEDGFGDYLKKYVYGLGHREYLERIGLDRLRGLVVKGVE